ncbi:MAG TPA: AraC family transcriptional regulator [Chitinophagaceae bacterium]|jgi:AraC-like DNA-binding protein|nr:AraC family transcriptional regulator [Chitinophagaceae bacterium]
MLEPSYRLINPQANRSFVFKWEAFDLTTRWHYHPEIELIFFIEGKTTGVVGDGFHEFEEGELVLLGANFPHVLQKHTAFANQHPKAKPFGLIIQFTEDFLGKDFILKPELQPVKQLLKRAERGIIFGKRIVEKLQPLLVNMVHLNESRKLISLLDLLTTLAETKNYRLLTSKDYAYDHTVDEERMKSIHQYIYEHFKDNISIPQIASIANMTETSFCRYFKSRTLKTFTRFLNEVRIAYACRLLTNVMYTVTDVCFESGFNNLSYFNRQFKTHTGMSPQQYQKWKKLALNN